MIRITMMVHNMIFLLLNDLLVPPGQAHPGGGCLTVQQDEDAGGDGKDRHYYGQASKAKVEQCDQPGQDEPDAQQDHAYIFGEFHNIPFLRE